MSCHAGIACAVINLGVAFDCVSINVLILLPKGNVEE